MEFFLLADRSIFSHIYLLLADSSRDQILLQTSRLVDSMLSWTRQIHPGISKTISATDICSRDKTYQLENTRTNTSAHPSLMSQL